MEIFLKKIRILILLVSCLHVWGIDTYGWSKAYFTPHDNLQSLLIERIKAEQKSIHCAMYMFTDQKIADALIDAFNRGVEVQLVVDQVSAAKIGKARFMQAHNIAVWTYVFEGYSPYAMSLMHNKFFIFQKNENDKPLLWTGSWNCTVGGTKRNYENVILTDEAELIDLYKKNFEFLKSMIEERG